MYDTLTIKFIPSLWTPGPKGWSRKTLPSGTCPDGRAETVVCFGVRAEFEKALALAEATVGVSVEKGKAIVLAENDFETDARGFERWLRGELGLTSPAETEEQPTPLSLLRAATPVELALQACARQLMASYLSHTPAFSEACRALAAVGLDHRGEERAAPVVPSVDEVWSYEVRQQKPYDDGWRPFLTRYAPPENYEVRNVVRYVAVTATTALAAPYVPPPCPAKEQPTPLYLLRAAVEARQKYWDAMDELETAIAGANGLTDAQSNAAVDHVDYLASFGAPEAIIARHLDGFMQALAITGTKPRALPAAEPVVVTPLTFDQFAEAYGNAMRQGGTTYTAADVDSSWDSYRRDPAGHFISKEKQEKP